jgi:enediyne biosynthesis protein E4
MKRLTLLSASCGALALTLLPGEAASNGGSTQITYTNIALNPGSGIDFRRAPSPALQAVYDSIKIKPFMSFAELYAAPLWPHGSPGVAILDYDNDGDEDVFVTNGPGRPNSLYRNQGAGTFTDVGVAAGVGAVDMDATGVCYGDLDNDGDEDLLVLGRMEPNRLFRNNGNGTFTQLLDSGLSDTIKGHSGCTMGDIDNDGLLDVFVANSFDWLNREAVYSDLYSFNHPNELYLNQGGNHFLNVSATSGVLALYNFPAGEGSITWAQAMVDLDQDGDADIIHGDDNGGLPPSGFAGVDRGYVQLFENDGAGHFTNVTGQSGSTTRSSAWMGISFGDLNCDGHMDFFMSSAGDYFFPQFGIATPPNLDSSRWMLALSDGSGGYVDTNLANIGVTNFGWGTGIADYDNDGDSDIIYYGSLDTTPVFWSDNPGTVLSNQDCSATFDWDRAATAATAERTLRQEVKAVALGDLNADGFVDIVTASGQYVPEQIPLVEANTKWGGAFDSAAFYLPTFTPIGPFEWEWTGVDSEDGFLDVKLSSAGNGNKWVKIRTKGTKGLTTHGRVNRDGIGAIVRFTPKSGKTSMTPVLGGSSHLSQHSLVQGFGLGIQTSGTVEIFWPGGVRNRLYNVLAGERLTLPEIPCSFSGSWPSRTAYTMCVDTALNQLVANGTITGSFRSRLRKSAIDAFASP